VICGGSYPAMVTTCLPLYFLSSLRSQGESFLFICMHKLALLSFEKYDIHHVLSFDTLEGTNLFLVQIINDPDKSKACEGAFIRPLVKRLFLCP
jgi:hypothetical protein